MPGSPIVLDAIGDIIAQTIDDYDKDRNQTQKYYNYPVIRLMEERRKATVGENENTHLRVREKGGFRWTGFFDAEPSTFVDVSLRLATPPRIGETDVAWDKMLEAINTGSAQLADVLLDEFEASEETHKNTLEEAFVVSPYNDASGTIQGVRGLGYWLRPLTAGTSDPTGGFNATTARFGDGTTSTTIAGQDASLVANSRLRSFAGTHTGTMSATLVNQLRLADIQTNFRTASMVFGAEQPQGQRQVRLMPTSFYAAYEQIVQAGTYEMGNDAMGKGTERIYARGLPAVAVPVLDAISYLPVYTLNTGQIRCSVWGGWWMKRTEPLRKAATVWELKVRSMLNPHAPNPRHLGHVFHQTISA